MTLDWWGLGLQAINVLVLVWLLGRVFWRPVAEAITRRQGAAQDMLDEGKTAQAKAKATLAEVTTARADMAAERDALLAKAKATAETETKAAQTAAKAQAESLVAAARATIDRDRKTAQQENADQAAALAVEIAAKLLDRFNTPAVQAAFLTRLVDAIADLSPSNRAVLLSTAADIEIVSAAEPDGAQQSEIEQVVREALGSPPGLRLVTDPDLIAGLELRSAHFVLQNSWRSDLKAILKEVAHAG